MRISWVSGVASATSIMRNGILCARPDPDSDRAATGASYGGNMMLAVSPVTSRNFARVRPLVGPRVQGLIMCPFRSCRVCQPSQSVVGDDVGFGALMFNRNLS